jgi:P63C domain
MENANDNNANNNTQSIQAMGGEARAKKLSQEQRSEIASKAATVKWKLLRAIYGTPDKKLKIGDRELECYVLENGTRVLSGRGMQEAIGLGKAHGAILKTFLSQDRVKSCIPNDLATAFENPVRFIRPGRGGTPATAYEATILTKLCDAILEGRKRGHFTRRQREIADQCEIVVRALSTVGIIGLVDEVTGYQQVRDREALQKILDKYLTDEWAKWSRTFPNEFYKELFRLKGIKYPAGDGKTTKPSYVGHWTNDIVYSRLAPGVLATLKVKNPRRGSGFRARKHHQHFTRDYGHPVLKEHLSNVTFLMKTCANDREFKQKLDLAAPKLGDTLMLPYPKEEG